MSTITRPRPARVVAVALALGVLLVASAAYADTGIQGPSYGTPTSGATAPTSEKPQSKLWYHDGTWWGSLFNPVTTNFEIYKYNRNTWNWSTTGVTIDDRATTISDALWDGTHLYVLSHPRTAAVGARLYSFTYASGAFVPLAVPNDVMSMPSPTVAVEEIVIAEDGAGRLWATWVEGGDVKVTHSAGSPHNSWIPPYSLPQATGLKPNPEGDASSIVAFDGKIGVMWSNQQTLLPDAQGFYFAVNDGLGDEPLNWTVEGAAVGVRKGDDHINLKAVGGDVYAAVKHSPNALDGSTAPEISVLHRAPGTPGTWTSHPVWQHAWGPDSPTRAILQIDTSANVAHVFMSQPCCSGGAVYHKQASLGSLGFTAAGLGDPFISLSTDVTLNNPTSSKETVNSSTGLLVLAGDDATHRYGYNYMLLPSMAPIVPAWPTGVTGLSANASVVLSWSAPGNNGGSAITGTNGTGYEVTPYVNGFAQTPQFFNSALTTQTVTGLTNGTAYTFTVKAKNTVGLGPASAPSLPVTPYTVPGAPTAVVAEAGNTSATVTWVPPLSNGGSPITGYTVVSSPGNVTVNAGAAATSATVNGLNNGTTYTFTVKATNIAGASAGTTSNSIVPRTLPGAPTNVSAVPGNASAIISWSAPANTGGLPLIGYVVTPVLNGVLQSPLSFLSLATTQTVTGLVNGTAYTFTVKATTLAGNGPASATSAAVTPRTVPGAPTGVVASGGDGSASVSWTAPASNGGAAITGYTVTPIVNGAAQTPRSFSSTTTTQAITGLANGTPYTFIVAAINVAGNGAASAASAAVTPRTIPGAPTDVTAVGGNASATVSWNAPTDNGGAAITGYLVTPHLNGVAQSPREFASSATSQTVGNLENDASYTFTVKATNVAGTGPASAPSAPVSTHHPAGYWMLGADGLVYGFGNAVDYGEPGTALGSIAAVDLEPTPSGTGYWVVDEKGRVYAYNAPSFQPSNVDESKLKKGEKVTSLSATPAGDGYWIFTNLGRVFLFGNAKWFDDLHDVILNGPVLDSIATPSGKGYFMVASDGGVFAFGDARFLGSMGGTRLNAPVQSLVPDPDGTGYWLVASDGGVFTFEAGFRGSLGGVTLNRPVTGMVPYGNGYLMVGEDGGIFNFSNLAFSGSLGSNPPARPIVSVAALD